METRENRAHRRRIAERGYASVMQMQARFPTIGLLARMYTLGRAFYQTARSTLLDTLEAPRCGAPRPRRDPLAAMTRFLRALTRITFLHERLADPIPLPQPTPPQPRPVRAEPATPRPSPPRRLSRADLARADIQRLLRRYTVRELTARLRRDLGLPDDPAEWNDAAILAAPSPSPPPTSTQPAAHPAAPPPIRPDSTTDPPSK